MRESQVTGYLSEYTGFIADPPAGRLQQIQYDPRTGALSFAVKLSRGVTLSRGSNTWVPTRNLYEFAGTVDSAVITGVLTHKLLEENRTTTEQDTIVLARQAADPNLDPRVFEEWTKTWEMILGFRGPKW
jgi:hypothetical protein